MILFVDDEKDIRDHYGDLMDNIPGVPYLLARNAIEAMEMLKNNFDKIEVIISDISMPEMNGLQFMEEVRALGFIKPFLIVTAFGDRKSTLRALRGGAFDIIEKPFNDNSLVELIKEAIRVSRELYLNLEKISKKSDLESMNQDQKKALYKIAAMMAQRKEKAS